MGKILNKFIFSITCLSLLFTFAFVGTSTNVLAQTNDDTEFVEISLASKETDLDISDIDTYYTSYERFIRATDKYDENITFLTVVKYTKRLYQEGISHLEGTGEFDGYEYAKAIKNSYLENFYQYWYIQSGFMDQTVSNISETRPNEIKVIYDAILTCVDNQDTAGVKNNVNLLIDEIYEDSVVLDSKGIYAKKFERPQEEVVVVDDDAAYYLSYNKFIKATNSDGSKLITKSEVAKQIEHLLNEGIRRIEAKESDFYEPFSNSYGYWYETSGFERKTMELISGSRVTAVELQFSSMKSAVTGGASLETIKAETSKLIEMLKYDAAYLDNLNGYIEVKIEKHNIYWRQISTTEGEWETLVSLSSLSGYDTTKTQGVHVAVDKTNTYVIWRYDGGEWANAKSIADLGVKSSNVAWLTFGGCFTIIIREGLEAILILGAIIAYLIKSGNKKQTKFVYIGAVIAVVASFLLAALLYGISSTGISTAVPQEMIEGITALIAVVVLVYVTNWMISKAESTAWTKYISGKVSTGASKGSVFTLVFTSFLAVFREGAEVVLFYQPLISSAGETSNGMLAVIGGMVLGLLVVAAVFAIIRIFGIKIPLKPFFVITSVLMGIMAIIFLGAGIWELFIDGGLLAQWGWPSGIITSIAWMSESDVLNFLGIYPTWWTIIPQIILTIVTVITFILWIKKGRKEALKEEENNEIVTETESADTASIKEDENKEEANEELAQDTTEENEAVESHESSNEDDSKDEENVSEESSSEEDSKEDNKD